MPQLDPSQVALPFDGTGHAVHDVPHVSGDALLTHVAPHWWKLALQLAMPHVPDAH